MTEHTQEVASTAMGISARTRGVYCNRTLNLRSIRAIGYDLDYTLVHYRVEAWEERAYEQTRRNLLKQGWPVENLRFDPTMVVRGLVVDVELGNLVKANRFGFVKKATHGTVDMDHAEQRAAYTRVAVDLSERRWIFLNTLFSLSEGCLYAQLVDLLDQGVLPGPMGYRELYDRVRDSLDATHVEGEMKADIVANPERFVEDDPETALALLDQKHAGKKLVLVTNSDWSYANSMMVYAIDRFLPGGMTWRDLFDIVVVGARKPDFFTTRSPFFEVATDDGLLRPGPRMLQSGKAYYGGSASQLEAALGISGDEVLYVGDHMFGDVHVSKRVLRWRTALILRELEDEIEAIEQFRKTERQLLAGMTQKEKLEAEMAHTRVALQRAKGGYGPPVESDEATLVARLDRLRKDVVDLDLQLAPLARQASQLSNERWGLLLRSGNDKSHLAWQLERYADIYTSRVSNLLHATPFLYLRSARGSLPHDVAVLPDGVPGSEDGAEAST